MTLHVDKVTVRFGSVEVLQHVSLTVDQGQRVAIMGPSGTGKSTLLRAIAGLVMPDAGSVKLDGEDITEVPTHLRPIGLMFQHYALFPHMSVAQNVEYGLRVQGADPDTARKHSSRLLDVVGLTDLADRNPSSLSGGEQQRVALARTLAPSPRVVLLDEPMGSVDNALKDSLMASTVAAIDTVGAAALYVTHDRQEAERFADTIGIMRDGSIVRMGSPEGIWSDPRTEFVARFIGHPNILDPDGPTLGPITSVPPTQHVKAVVPIPAIRVAGSGVRGTVSSASFADGTYRLTVVTSEEEELVVESDTRIHPGDEVFVAIDPELVRLVAADEV